MTKSAIFLGKHQELTVQTSPELDNMLLNRLKGRGHSMLEAGHKPERHSTSIGNSGKFAVDHASRFLAIAEIGPSNYLPEQGTLPELTMTSVTYRLQRRYPRPLVEAKLFAAAERTGQ